MIITLHDYPQSRTVPASTWAPWLDEDSEKAEILRDFWIVIDGYSYCVPAGYVTDWASIPAWIEWLYPHDASQFRRAALVHDYFYSHLWPIVSKNFADAAFREILKIDGVPIIRRNMFYAAVRIGGRGGWHIVNDVDAHPFWSEQRNRILDLK